VLAARDRGAGTTDAVLRKADISAARAVLEPVLDADDVLCSDCDAG
jgi:hypothetical protein